MSDMQVYDAARLYAQYASLIESITRRVGGLRAPELTRSNQQAERLLAIIDDHTGSRTDTMRLVAHFQGWPN